LIDSSKISRLLYTFRGIANDTLTPEFALKVGQIVGAEMLAIGHGRMLMAGDHRSSTPMLKAALSAGLLSSGVDVTDFGMCPSPTLAFAVKREGCPGAMITASHNPPEWNGIQLLEPDSHICGPEREQEIKEQVLQVSEAATWDRLGQTRLQAGLIDEHIGALVGRVNPDRRLKVVVDLGSGMAALAVPGLLERLGAEAICIHEDLDPLFASRPSEPRPEHLGRLCEEVVARGADVGLAYDGDCDRMVVVDETGNHVEGDRTILLLGLDTAEHGRMVLNASTSMVTHQELEEAGFEIQLARWGQTFLGAMVRDSGACFGGEPDGHFIWPDLSLRADAVASTAYLYDALSRSEGSLSEAIGRFPRTRMINEKIEWDRDLADYRESITGYGGSFERFEEIHPRLYVMTQNGSKLAVRQSPFDSTLRIFAESYEPAQADRLAAEVKELLLG
jgi:phosphomannomutase / phosphoglucomutase